MRKVKCFICGDPMNNECKCKYEKNHLGSYNWIGPESGENIKVDQSQHQDFNTPGQKPVRLKGGNKEETEEQRREKAP